MTEPTPEETITPPELPPYQQGYVFDGGLRLRAIRYNKTPPMTYYYPNFGIGVVVAGEAIASTFEVREWEVATNAEG